MDWGTYTGEMWPNEEKREREAGKERKIKNHEAIFPSLKKSQKCLLSLATRRTLNTSTDNFRELVVVDLLCQKIKNGR